MSYVDTIIQAFGGVRPLAAAIKKPVSTVGSWASRGSMSDEAKALCYATAQNMGLALTKEDFFPTAVRGGLVVDQSKGRDAA
jgi:hypothetical protein